MPQWSSIANTATVTGTPPTGSAVTDTDSALVEAIQGPGIDIEKSASPTTYGAPGQVVTYTFEVTNSGNVTLDGVRVSDPLAGLSPLSCAPAQPASLDPGATMTCTATYTTTQADVNRGSIANTATVTGTPPTGSAVTDTDSALVEAIQGPGIDIEKSASPTTYGAPGQVVTYTFEVTNSGNVTLTDVRVSDPLAGLSPLSCAPAQPASLDPGATMTCTATYTTTQADVNRGSIANTATVTGTPPTGSAVTDTDSALVEAIQGPGIDIEKSASPTTYGAPGQVVTYTFEVTNSGNVTLDGVRVSDPLAGLSPLSCAPAQPASLDPGATMTCTATYTTTQADVNRGSIANTATVTGTPPTGSAVTDTDSALVEAIQGPGIDIEKSASPTTYGAPGQVVTYTFEVTNSGNVTLDGVRVSDPLAGLSPLSCAPAQPASLDPGATMTCTATYTTTQADVNRGSIANTATVTGTPPTGSAVTDTDSVTATVEDSGPTPSPSPPPPTTAGASSPHQPSSVPSPPSGSLPFTGANVTADLIAAMDAHRGRVRTGPDVTPASPQRG